MVNMTQDSINSQTEAVGLVTQYNAARTIATLAHRAGAQEGTPLHEVWEMLGIDLVEVRGSRESNIARAERASQQAEVERLSAELTRQEPKTLNAAQEVSVGGPRARPVKAAPMTCRVCGLVLVSNPDPIPKGARRKYSDTLCIPDARKTRKATKEAKATTAVKEGATT